MLMTYSFVMRRPICIPVSSAEHNCFIRRWESKILNQTIENQTSPDFFVLCRWSISPWVGKPNYCYLYIEI